QPRRHLPPRPRRTPRPWLAVGLHPRRSGGATGGGGSPNASQGRGGRRGRGGGWPRGRGGAPGREGGAGGGGGGAERRWVWGVGGCGEWVRPERKAGPGRPPGPRREMPAGLVYATVKKRREKGRVVEVIRSLVFGVWGLLEVWLRRSEVSNTINTSFVERNNATDRHQNGRKRRKGYGFSRSKRMHDCATYLVS